MADGHVGMTRRDVAVGAGVALLVHAVLGVALALAPAQETGVAAPEKVDKEGCTSVVSPSCIGQGPRRKPKPIVKKEEPQATDERRCPEPARRLLRREEEPPPSLNVDLLQAQLVAALGSEDGNRRDPGEKQALPKPPEKKLAEAMTESSKLTEILKDDGADAKKKKLGNILGTATGVKEGQGKVNMSGSAYAGTVKQNILSHFQVPSNIPPWELTNLVVRVRIDRMTTAGTILSYKIDKKSGNEAFDDAVAAYMAGYKAGVRTLPPPPEDVLLQINSRGFVIDFAAKH